MKAKFSKKYGLQVECICQSLLLQSSSKQDRSQIMVGMNYALKIVKADETLSHKFSLLITREPFITFRMINMPLFHS